MRKTWTTVGLTAWLLVSAILFVLGVAGVVLWIVLGVCALYLWGWANGARTPEARAARVAGLQETSARLSMEAKERKEVARIQKEHLTELQSRTVSLVYMGGHPQLTRRVACKVVRSQDGSSVELFESLTGKGILTIPTAQIRELELVSREKILTQTRSGTGRAVVGGMIAGPVGAIVGATSGRRSNTHSERDDMLHAVLVIGGSRIVMLFKGPGGSSAHHVYPKAAKVLAPDFGRQAEETTSTES